MSRFHAEERGICNFFRRSLALEAAFRVSYFWVLFEQLKKPILSPQVTSYLKQGACFSLEHAEDDNQQLFVSWTRSLSQIILPLEWKKNARKTPNACINYFITRCLWVSITRHKIDCVTGNRNFILLNKTYTTCITQPVSDPITT